MKRFTILITIILYIFILSSCQQTFKLIDKNKIIVGIEGNYEPYNWIEVHSNDYNYPIDNLKGSFIAGYDVSIASLIANKLDKELVFKQYKWENLQNALKNKDIDMIISGMSNTKERSKRILFSEPYFQNDFVVVVNKNSSYTNFNKISQFLDNSFGYQADTTNEILLSQIPLTKKLVPYSNYTELTTALVNNEIDSFLIGEQSAESIVKNNPSLSYVSFKPGNGFNLDGGFGSVSIGLNHNNKLLKNKINDFLSSFTTNDRNDLMNLSQKRYSNYKI